MGKIWIESLIPHELPYEAVHRAVTIIGNRAAITEQSNKSVTKAGKQDGYDV